MNISQRTQAFAFVLFSLLAASCRTSPTEEPTLTPPPTPTSAPTAMATPTFTASPIPTDTPPPTATPTPTTPPSTATTAPSPTPTGQYLTEFDDAAELDQWVSFRIDPDSLRRIEGAPEQVSAQIDEGKFRLEIRQEFAWMYYIFQPLETADVKLETEVTNVGRNNNNVSLLCRYSEDGWYEFNIANNGLYWIFRYDSNVRDYIELASGGTNSINMGQGTNRISAICQGDQLSLYINGGTPIKTVTDRNLSQGQIGLSVSSFGVLPIILEFDRLHVSVP